MRMVTDVFISEYISMRTRFLVDFAKLRNALIFLTPMFIQQAFNVYYALTILLGLLNIRIKRQQTWPSGEKGRQTDDTV